MRRIAFAAAIAVAAMLLTNVPLRAQQPPQYNGPGPQQTGPNGPNMIPAGTSISIRTNENITASEAQPSASYSAEISEDVTGPDGQLLIPRGTPARLAVVSTGNNDLALALQSLRVNGREYNVESSTTNGGVGGTGIGKNKRTAEYIGGGALLGTVIGAIAGGGKGAAIGAIAGGGAGAGAQVLTKGKQINVPAESVLTFHLDEPIQLR